MEMVEYMTWLRWPHTNELFVPTILSFLRFLFRTLFQANDELVPQYFEYFESELRSKDYLEYIRQYKLNFYSIKQHYDKHIT